MCLCSDTIGITDIRRETVVQEMSASYCRRSEIHSLQWYTWMSQTSDWWEAQKIYIHINMYRHAEFNRNISGQFNPEFTPILITNLMWHSIDLTVECKQSTKVLISPHIPVDPVLGQCPVTFHSHMYSLELLLGWKFSKSTECHADN